MAASKRSTASDARAALANVPPILSSERLAHIEARWDAPDEHAARRLALIFSTYSGGDLLKQATDRDHAVGMADAAECIRSYSDRMRALLELLDAAEARIMTAIEARDDCDDVIADASARHTDDDLRRARSDSRFIAFLDRIGVLGRQ